MSECRRSSWHRAGLGLAINLSLLSSWPHILCPRPGVMHISNVILFTRIKISQGKKKNLFSHLTVNDRKHQELLLIELLFSHLIPRSSVNPIQSNCAGNVNPSAHLDAVTTILSFTRAPAHRPPSLVSAMPVPTTVFSPLSSHCIF